MPFLPLSFFVAILLVILFVGLVRAGNDSGSRNIPFLALILLSAFQAFLSGLRWGYDIVEVMYVAPVGAAFVPPLVYCGVTRLVHKEDRTLDWSIVLHSVPAFAIVILLTVTGWRSAIDVVLPALFIGYAGAILNLMRRGPDALRKTPFESALPVYRALVFAALALLMSAALDLLVFLDFSWTQGKHAPSMVAIGNLIALVVLSIAAAVAVQGRESSEVEIEAPTADEPSDKETLAAIQSLMETRHSYRDPELNLDRLARKAVIPARQISSAINRTTGKNVSQYVNEFRIAEACQLLAETEKSVTEVMLDVGFQTKSNFNREFRRVTDMAPVQWRSSRANTG
ncbi:AraC family transcriptional regulator [uncultured Agrobacterium sp.]|uniref:helix-turn-helix domain-containing protein n=1 Tax=uncultured Agrobacterium sp. TaxID=157277 RepID=UPI0025FC4384|nr:AraC family transcriptional regulator [uncultured Agrobacterium sp.]